MTPAAATLDAVPNALLLEDDGEDRLAVRLQLEIMGLAVYDTASPREAMELFPQRDYSVVIIHVGHAPLASLEICRLIRAASTVPILMLTQRDEVVDEHMCLQAGADDYISKPIETRILVSRINQQLKRGESQRAPRASTLAWGPLEMDLAQHSFRINGNDVSLTNTEYMFLQLLMEDPKRVFTREQVLNAIGVMRGNGADHIVNSHASRLRRKIRQNGGPEVIAVVRSVGYRLTESDSPPEMNGVV
jgi:DNA-binding response OmpR family regulator